MDIKGKIKMWFIFFFWIFVASATIVGIMALDEEYKLLLLFISVASLTFYDRKCGKNTHLLEWYYWGVLALALIGVFFNANKGTFMISLLVPAGLLFIVMETYWEMAIGYVALIGGAAAITITARSPEPIWPFITVALTMMLTRAAEEGLFRLKIWCRRKRLGKAFR